MTEEDQDAAIGRLVTKYSAAKKRRAALIAEAATIGQTLDAAGTVMKGLGYYREMSDGTEDYGTRRTNPVIQSYVNAEKVLSLVDELKAVSAEVRELRKLVKDAGLNVD